MRRYCRILVLVLMLASAFGLCVLDDALAAELSVGSIHVQINDAAYNRPVALARVFVIGPHSDVGYTTTEGVVEFRDYPVGSYRLSIYAPGYAVARIEFEVVAGQIIDVAAALVPQGHLSTIGSVVARRSPSAIVNHASASDLLALSAGGLSEALSRLPAISSRPGGVALDGLSLSATSVTADGAPLAAAGRSAALSSIGLDLFSSVTAQPLGGPSAPGINLFTNDPTIAFSATGLTKYDSLGGAGEIFGVTGTAGSLGFVAKHVDRESVGRLNGSAYRDASGLIYPHADEASGSGTLVKIRAPLSQNQSLIGEASRVQVDMRPACVVASGGTPCGFGPGNGSRQEFSSQLLRYLYAFPNANLGFTISNSTQSDRLNLLQRVVNNFASPLLSTSLTALSSISGHFDRSYGLKHVLSFDATSELQKSTSTVPGLLLPASSERFATASLSETYTPHVGKRLLAALDLSSLGRPGFRFGFDAADTKGGEATLSVRLMEPRQPALPEVPFAGSLADPASASYDCLHRDVFVNGIGDTPGVAADTGGTFSYKRRIGDSAFEAQAAHDSVVGGTVPIVSRGSASGVNAITPSSLAAISTFYASPGACGETVTLTPSSIVINAAMTARLMYDRLTISAAKQVRGAIVAPYVQYTNARYDAGDGVKALPFVPHYRVGLLVDAPLKRARAELLGYVDYVGSNNASGLPPHAEASIGMSARLAHGSVTFGLQNIGQTLASKFASSALAAPLPNGIVPIARPLAPRTMHLSYNIAVGSAAPPARVDALAALASVAQPASDMFSLSFTPLTGIPPEHPFEPELTRDSCTPESVAVARTVLNAMREEVSRESQLSADGDTDVRFDPGIGVKITAHRRHGRVAFALSVDDSRTAGRITACIRMQVATVEDLRARGAYIPTDAESDAVFLFFDPIIGAYRVLGVADKTSTTSALEQPTVNEVVLDPPPSSAPAEPFAVRAMCPDRLRPFARTVLGQLAREVPVALSGKGAQSSPYFHLTVVASDSRRWVQIRFMDAASHETIDICGHVAGVSEMQLRLAGINKRPEDLGFTPELGLFEAI